MSTLSAQKGTGSGGLARFLPAIVLLAAVIGAVLVLPMVGHDQSSRTWYRGLIGGSNLYRLDTIFSRLLPFVIGAAIAVALLERGRARRLVVAAGDSLRRHELSEVITHWGNAVGVGLCIITATWLKRWFGRPFSLETTYILHFIGAGLIVAAVTHHITFQRVGGGTGLIPKRRADFKNAVAEMVGYLGIYRGLPGAFGIQMPAAVRRPAQKVVRKLHLVPDPDGKYLATEKVLSYSLWFILIGIVVITGVLKTLRYAFSMPAGLLHWSTYLHDGATIFLIVLLALHVGALVLVPRNWPLLKSMFTTRVSRAYAKAHLPLWAEEEEAAEKH
jgi:cytochrome b subunit of formate dehydrogenase